MSAAKEILFRPIATFGAALFCHVPVKAAPLPEFLAVRAITEIHEGGDIVPRGATGTVVDVMQGGAGYFVEFTAPVHAVVSVRKDQIIPA